VLQCGDDVALHGALSAECRCQGLGDGREMFVGLCQHRLDRLHQTDIAIGDMPDAPRVRIVVLMRGQRRGGAGAGVLDAMPKRRIGEGMLRTPMRRAGGEDRGFVREVAVEREPRHTGPLGDGADGRMGRAPLFMQRDGGIDDALAGLRLGFRPRR